MPIFNSATTGSDGGDWYDRYGIFPGAVESATVSGGTLYTAQGAGRAYCVAHCNDPKNPPTLQQVLKEPAIFISKYDVNSWSNVGERWIWNSTLSFAWPELQTDGAGEVGLVFRAAADNHNARPVAGFLTPAEQFVYADPEGLPHRTGDYYTLRPGRTLRSFVMTAQTVVPDVSTGTNQMHWQYIEYGHGASPYVSPPNVHITTPTDLATFTQGDSVTYSANVSDPVDGTLPASAIVWTEDGSFIGTGPSVARTEDAIGTHLIKVTATNGDGKSASDSVSVRINPKPGALHLSITSPADQSAFRGPYNNDPSGFCVNVSFTTSVSGAAGPVTYKWVDVRDQGAPQQLSTAASPTLDLCTAAQFDSSSTHDLTVTASDGVNIASASLRIFILGPPIP